MRVAEIAMSLRSMLENDVDDYFDSRGAFCTIAVGDEVVCLVVRVLEGAAGVVEVRAGALLFCIQGAFPANRPPSCCVFDERSSSRRHGDVKTLTPTDAHGTVDDHGEIGSKGSDTRMLVLL